MSNTRRDLPLVYACSGCSSAAQMANFVAVRLDREHVAEMSCIAGVGGDVLPLVKLARSGRPILAIDGCRLHCVRNCLARHGVSSALHYCLADSGVRKRMHDDFDVDEAEMQLATVREAVCQLSAKSAQV